jgi:hypothetical protein
MRRQRIVTIPGMFIFCFSLVAFGVGCDADKTKGWLPVKERPDVIVTVAGDSAETRSAPYPEITLKSGNIKLIESTVDKKMFQLSYKIAIEPAMNKLEKNMSKYTPYLYQIRYRFILLDKDNVRLQEIDGPNNFEIIEWSKVHTSQNVCFAGINPEVKSRTAAAYVEYFMSAKLLPKM